MWHFKSKDGEYEVNGTRQELKEKLNIFVVGLYDDHGNYYEEIADVYTDHHWRQICKDYGIWGNDD